MANSRGRGLVLTVTALLALAVAGCGGDGPETGAAPSADASVPAPGTGRPSGGPLDGSPGGSPGGGEGETAPPVGPSAQPWQIPEIDQPAGPDLDGRTLDGTCAFIFPTGGDVRIVRYTLGSGTEDDFTDAPAEYLTRNDAEESVPATLGLTETPPPILPEEESGQTSGACRGSTDGAGVPTGPWGAQPCGVDIVLTPTKGCSLWLSDDPLPPKARPGSYRIPVSMRLSKLCKDTAHPACQDLTSVTPTPETPVRVFWDAEAEVVPYVVWVNGEAMASFNPAIW
ncbi:hypothetical protein [Actinocorallia herbida]|nr:hypothetical protein [Actinocorallia herbida]